MPSSTRHRQFIYPQMAPMAQIDSQNCRGTTLRVASYAVCFAWAVEFLQLYHAPWIDGIRSARLGHLVLGSVFNGPDLVAYVVGIGVGVVVEWGIRRVGRWV